jgi:hypothetical protein
MVTMTSTILWDVAPCGPDANYRTSGVEEKAKQETSNNNTTSKAWFPLEKDAVSSSEKLRGV